ncbi:MAG: transcriptional repressor NrdR [Chloroflexi bacterium]|nr:MAG: transcriptional repressor NrdR [Chloroflexota bacterium]
MRCPHCGYAHHKVIDTRETGEGIRRRRRCERCDQRFTTYEYVAASLLVVKSDGRREAYDRQKLLAGIQIAATKRPISGDAIEEMVTQIEDALHSLGRSEVPSSMIGNLVLDHLARLDQVAYIRFASVYLEMNDLDELRGEIDRLMGR